MAKMLPKSALKKKVSETMKKVRPHLKKKKGIGNIAHLFGSSPNEVDGMAFQKKVRKEWD